MVVNSFTFLCHLFTVNLNNSVQRFIALHSPKLKFQCTERNIKSSRRLLFYCTYIYISFLVSSSLSFSRLRFIRFLLAAVHIRRKHIWNASNGSQPNWGANQTNKLNRNTEQQKKGKKIKELTKSQVFIYTMFYLIFHYCFPYTLPYLSLSLSLCLSDPLSLLFSFLQIFVFVLVLLLSNSIVVPVVGMCFGGFSSSLHTLTRNEERGWTRESGIVRKKALRFNFVGTNLWAANGKSQLCIVWEYKSDTFWYAIFLCRENNRK